MRFNGPSPKTSRSVFNDRSRWGSSSSWRPITNLSFFLLSTGAWTFSRVSSVKRAKKKFRRKVFLNKNVEITLTIRLARSSLTTSRNLLKSHILIRTFFVCKRNSFFCVQIAILLMKRRRKKNEHQKSLRLKTQQSSGPHTFENFFPNSNRSFSPKFFHLFD